MELQSRSGSAAVPELQHQLQALNDRVRDTVADAVRPSEVVRKLTGEVRRQSEVLADVERTCSKLSSREQRIKDLFTKCLSTVESTASASDSTRRMVEDVSQSGA